MTQATPGAPVDGATGSRRDWQQLDQAERRRLVWLALVRPAVSVLLLVVVYFWVPFEGFDDAATAIGLAAGLLAVLALLGWQVYGVTRARYPLLRAIQAAVVGVPLYLLAFSACYSVMAHALPGSFSEPVTRMGALYFTVTVFATVGFGDITATTDVTRAVVTVQMVLNLVLLAVGLRILTLAIRVGQERNAGVAATDGEPPP